MTGAVVAKLDTAHRIAIIIVAVFLAGAAMSGWLSVPARVTEVETAVDTLRTQHTALRQEITDIRDAQKLILCLELADRNKVDWRQLCKDAVLP